MSSRKENKSELTAALKDVLKAPHKGELWEKVEDIAATQQRPDEVGELYRKVMREAPRPELVAAIGQRAVKFHEEWFGAQSDALVELLTEILAVDPGAEWALRRLTVLYAVKERWSDLLALYDRSLAAIDDAGHRRELLAEAANIAKDFVGDIDRAIGYLHALWRLQPADGQLSVELERLLERQGRWNELADFWTARLGNVGPDEARALRERTALLRLEKLGDAGGALAEVRPVLAEGQNDGAACALVERILRMTEAPLEVRREALLLLKGRYESSGQTAALGATLEAALDFANPVEQAALVREMGERLAKGKDHVGAMEQFVILLGLEPNAEDVVDRLRHLAELEGDVRPYVRGLDAAAGAAKEPNRRAELWLESARVHEETLDDASGAIEYLRRAFAERGGDPKVRLESARRLADLLGRLPEAAADPAERLTVLEALAGELAGAGALAQRRAVLSEVAKLAEGQGDADRAIAAITRLGEDDPGDRATVDGLVGLLERHGRWDRLVAALRRRVKMAAAPAERRLDLRRIAELEASALGTPEAAIETWREIQTTFGEDGEAVAALAALYERLGRFGELAEVLSRGSEREQARLCDEEGRLGDAYREKLEDPKRAAQHYARALRLDPKHAASLQGLRALASDEAARPAAVAALAAAYEASGEWLALYELCETRLALAPDAAARAELLREAARIAERQAGDREAAAALLARALPLLPDDPALERDLVRLGEAAKAFAAVADALAAAAGASKDPVRAAHLRFAEGKMREANLGDPAGALAAYLAVFEQQPEAASVREAIVRTAAQSGRWDLAAQYGMAQGLPRPLLEGTLLPLLDGLASSAEAFGPLSEAAAGVMSSQDRFVEPALARDLEVVVARWCARAGDGAGNDAAAGDAAAERAEAALLRAARYSKAVREGAAPTRDAQEGKKGPRTGFGAAGELLVLERLAQAQRRHPDRALCETLLQIADLRPGDLDPLREAAALALGPVASEPMGGAILARLLEQAARLLRAGQAAVGKTGAEEAAVFATEELVRLELGRTDRSAWQRAVQLLLDAVRLPLDRGVIRRLRWRAVEIAQDPRILREVLRQMVEDDAADSEARSKLGALYEEQRRLPELLALRSEELERAAEVERRLSLRLEIEKLAGTLEQRSGRLEVLKANLEEQPGHRPTIDSLATFLESRGRQAELVEVLSDQATRLEERNERGEAARMWDWIAHLTESALGDRRRAIRAYERVANLGPQPETFETLGRLTLAQGDAEAAGVWLERWYEATQGGVRVRAALELANAYLQAEKTEAAMGCLDRTLAEAPGANEVRAQLIELYRRAQTWPALVKALSEGASHVTDKDTIFAYAREAAEVSQSHLGSLQPALGALEKAVATGVADSALRAQYAEALTAAGDLARARDILEFLVKESGRRRSKDRASLHLKLARVARFENKLPEALSHLEQAAEMDMDSAGVLADLGEVAETLGEHDRAERAYRALVLLGRRNPGASPVAATEALLRLRRIALSRGQTEKAQDLLDSAVAEAANSPVEAQRLGASLRADGELGVLRQVLEKRLTSASAAEQQAAILTELGELAVAEGRPHEALTALLQAVEKAPAAIATRKETRQLAKDQGHSDRYVEVLLSLAEQKRRGDEAPLTASLLAEAGDVLREELGDGQRAAETYAKATDLGASGGKPGVAAAAALVRLAEERGGAGERNKALKVLVRMSKPSAPVEVRAEALFFLATLQIGREETREQALTALSSALDLSDDVERAFAIVKEANVPDSDLPRVLPLYERVARASGDSGMLLDFFRRRSALPGAIAAEAREGAELALSLKNSEAAAALLERTIELCQAQGQTAEEAGKGQLGTLEWALLSLAEVRREMGDIAGAVACLEEARELADPVRVLLLYQEIAKQALHGAGDPAVAARVYERLWEREPAERHLWEPLLQIYAKLGDRAGVERVARATAARLFDPRERNGVRMILARFLRDLDKGDPALIETLRGVLEDEPVHQEAIELLADVYQASGNEEGLTELLLREIEAARTRQDLSTVVALSLRLGERHVAQGARAEAREVFREALRLAPDDVGILRALVDLLSPDEDAQERAALQERLLGSELGPQAGRLAMELASLWESLGQDDRVRQALEMGVARAQGDQAVFERLGEFYRSRQAWDRLAALLEEEVERRTDAAVKAQLLRQGAEITRTNLARPKEAAAFLRKARGFAPDDVDLLAELVTSLDALGDAGAAAEELSRALDRLPAGSPDRVVLLGTKAELLEKAGEFALAVQDREEALREGGEGLRLPLIDALDRWKTHAAERGDAQSERLATLRLVELLKQSGEAESARSTLADWCNRHPEDAESLRTLAAEDRAAGRWENVVENAFRLIEVETDHAQLTAAELLLEACNRLGQPGPAMAGLEAALQQQPESRWLYDSLTKLYDEAGERRKQAALLLWSAERSGDPDRRYESLRRAGEIFLQERDLPNATAALQKAIELRPAERELSLLLADVCIAGGRLAEAEEILEGHMKQMAKDLSSAELSELQHRMAQLAHARGDQAGRLEWLRRAFDTNRKNGTVAVELADLAEEMNELDLAVKALRAVTLLPNASATLTPARAFLRQAHISLRSGDRPRAVIFAKRALQEDPRLSDAGEFLREIGERRA